MTAEDDKLRYINPVTVDGRVYYYFRPPAEMRKSRIKPKRLSDNRAEAIAQVAEMLQAWRSGSARRQLRRRQRHIANLHLHLAELLSSARKRATRNGSQIDIDLVHIEDMLVQQQYRCAVSGIPFDLQDTMGKEVFRRPFRPSIDRIDSSVGYLVGNCRLVCVAVNVALSDWGDDVFFRIVDAVADRRKNTRATDIAKPGCKTLGRLLVDAI